ncbi:hypothetical protein [Ilyobacter polytropus]|uniref:GPW/gp25 family protein n=1 Tax=Ilyobacter polytropus (strain ATCC 51220 / DSM 2926 / LMG 16218 / CuHBu1) TaxID=572544 RepID=E3HBK7_ILYPC|nr:hypothetical protein [Ilyobacter polytropus]ADO83703.1 conserved hypothetical protein [Ilyobacter polytropus DSM 2926]
MTEITTGMTMNLNATGTDRVIQNCSNLLGTVLGELILGRYLGVSRDLVDKPIDQVKGEYSSAIVTMLEEYEPVTVEDIEFEYDVDGKITPKVVISINE